jgi:hypothetical protein
MLWLHKRYALTPSEAIADISLYQRWGGGKKRESPIRRELQAACTPIFILKIVNYAPFSAFCSTFAP